MDVRKERKTMVIPFVPTPKTKLKLSLLDHIQPPVFVGIIFYYKDNGLDIHEKLVKLEKSLSETLVLFYPFAGRYLEEGGFSFIDCRDQGVEYIVAKVDDHLDLLLHNEIDPDMLANLSSYPTELDNGTSLIVIQVNVFKCGGLAIGIRFNHKMADTCTLSMFMGAWSKACNEGIKQVISPSFNLGTLIPQKEIGDSDYEMTKLRPPTHIISKKFVLKKFTFYNDVILKLRAEITEKLNEINPDSTSLQASRVEVVSAVISKAIIEIKSAKQGINLKPFVIYHAMNVRGKTNLHVAENSCGNFFTRVVTPSRILKQTEITTLSILDMICEEIRKAKLQFSLARDVDVCSLMEVKHKEFADAWRKTVDGEINFIPFSSWSKFPFYEVNFGWGKPNFVSTNASPIELIILIDTKLHDGIDAWVTLDINDMSLFKNKLDTILQF